jgi:putative FmdB family regulatory protein
MAIYDYICENCSFELEIEQSPSKYKILKKCPQCHKLKLNRNYENLNLYTYTECRSLGVLAERNSNPSSVEFQDRKRKDKINFGIQKFEPQIKRGVIDRDQAKDLIEKHIDVETPWGEMDKKDEKKIFSGTKEEQATKMETYIEKGTV